MTKSAPTASPTGRQLGPGKRDELPPIVSEGVGAKPMIRPDLDAMEAVAKGATEALRNNGHCGEGTFERNERRSRVDRAMDAYWGRFQPEASAALLAYIREIEGALESAALFIEELAAADLDDIAADGGITVGMVFQQQARTVFGPRARSALSKATGEGG